MSGDLHTRTVGKGIRRASLERYDASVVEAELYVPFGYAARWIVDDELLHGARQRFTVCGGRRRHGIGCCRLHRRRLALDLRRQSVLANAVRPGDTVRKCAQKGKTGHEEGMACF